MKNSFYSLFFNILVMIMILYNFPIKLVVNYFYYIINKITYFNKFTKERFYKFKIELYITLIVIFLYYLSYYYQ